jgi:hypothetical protein
MIQCKDCEYFEQNDSGQRVFRCDPFCNIKEPDCLMKWQILRLDLLLRQHQATLSWQHKMSPIQDKIFKYIKRELDDMDDADHWKFDEYDDNME